jgi:hypothetical protein
MVASSSATATRRYERAVDLDLADRQRLEQRQGGVAGAEVGRGQADAVAVQLRQGLGCAPSSLA